MKVLEYFGHEAFLEYSSFITEINELGFDREISGCFQIFSHQYFSAKKSEMSRTYITLYIQKYYSKSVFDIMLSLTLLIHHQTYSGFFFNLD